LVLTFLGAAFSILYSCSSETEKSEVEKPVSPKEEAKQLYTLHCASCHGMDGKLGGSGSKDLSQSSLSEAAMIEIITNGKNNMPAMKDLITDSTKIKNLADFIKTLRK
jgi:cytochrome c6